MIVRPATHDDVDAIVSMSREFYATTDYAKHAPMCDDTVANLACMLIDTGVMLVAVDGRGRHVGMVGLVVAPGMFNRETTGAHEIVWYVDPEAQGAGAGKALLAAIESACRERGATLIQMVHLSTSPPAAAALYERNGFRYSESCYTKEIHPWQPSPPQ